MTRVSLDRTWWRIVRGVEGEGWETRTRRGSPALKGALGQEPRPERTHRRDCRLEMTKAGGHPSGSRAQRTDYAEWQSVNPC